MNIWSKALTALRGRANEAGEAMLDSQALRILDQEVRDASEELKISKNSLAELMAREKLSAEKCNNLRKDITEHADFAEKALKKDNEPLALEIAQRIADLENRLSSESATGEGYGDSVQKLKRAILQTERNIKLLKQQVDTVKATESVQKAQAAVAERHSGSNSKLQTAMDSLHRIKEKQNLREAQMSAANELAEETSDTSLKQKLMDEGITSCANKAEDILQKIKDKQAVK